MSNSSANILRAKVAAGAIRRSKSSLSKDTILIIEKAISKVFLELSTFEHKISVDETNIHSTENTVAKMSSSLFGVIHVNDTTGLCGIDRSLINALIEILTGASSKGYQARNSTCTDTAFAKLFFDNILSETFDSAPNVKSNEITFSQFVEEKAPLPHVLPDAHFALLRISVRNTDIENVGTLELAVPVEVFDFITTSDEEDSSENSHDNWRTAVAQHAITSKIALTSVVERRQVTLNEILNFKVGNLIELSEDCLGNLSLEAPCALGRRILFRGKLGTLKSNKAFKISQLVTHET